MKTLEVIDLLSSPEVPLPKAKPVRPVISSLKNASSSLKEAIAARPAPPVTSKQNGEWVLLSDDENAPASKVMSPRPARRPLKARINDLGSDDFWNFGNDTAATPRTSGQNVSGKGKGQLSKDFFYLSDDFDSSVNPDQSHLLGIEPPIKKRKLSMESKDRVSLMPTGGYSKGKGLTRSSSEVGASLKGGTSSFNAAKACGLRRTKSIVIEEDPILFTSSPDFIARITTEKKAKPNLVRERDLNDDPILFSSSPDVVRAARERREKARRTRELESNDECDDVFGEGDFGRTGGDSRFGDSASLKAGTVAKRKTTSLDDASSDLEFPDILSIASQVSTSTISRPARKDSEKILARYNAEKATAQKVKVAAQKASEKDRRAQERLESKEVEKERKRLAKLDKVIEKQVATDLAKANLKRTEKKISTPEMIVDLPKDLERNVATQVGRMLEPLGAECGEWNSSIPNVIRWRRKIEARYNDELGYWEPTTKHVKIENQVMCIMPAKEFVELSCCEEGHDLDAHVLNMKARFSGYSIIYLIEGLAMWQRKNKNVKNRQFTDAVRSQMNENLDAAASSQQPKKKKTKQAEYVDADMIEDALLSLQVLHGVLVHHTGAAVETAEWVVIFTQHISTAPYRQQQMALDSAFCMESGQVKTGDDAADTFVKMLQEVNRITAPIAYGIAAEYPSAQKLVAGFEKHGKNMLQSVRKTANKDGALTDREIGVRLSHRVYNIFMGRDEGSTDV